jgi:hypothetical protein
MALSVIINKVSTVFTTIPANTKVADIVVSGGTSPYNYSLATGGDSFQLVGTQVQTKVAMTLSNIASFSVTVTDSTPTTPETETATSTTVYPSIQAGFQNKFSRSNVIYKVTKVYDLRNGVLTIPSGCTLDFQGGIFTNGSIVFNDTYVKADYYVFNNVHYSGKIINPINVIWFGAKGDGTTDDSDAILQALRSDQEYDYGFSSANPGNTIYLPKGTYLTTKTLYVRKGCILTGDSSGNTFIRYIGASRSNAIILGKKSDDTPDSGGLQPVVSKLFIISPTAGNGIYTDQAGWKIQDCWFTCNIGIVASGVDGIIDNCVQDGGQVFLSLTGGDVVADPYNQSHSIVVSNCITYACTYAAISLAGINGVTITNCAFYYSKQFSIEVANNSGNVLISNCDFRTSADPNYYVESNRHISCDANKGLINSIISNCTFSLSRQYDLNLNSCRNLLVSDCIFKDGNGSSILLTNNSLPIKISNCSFENYKSNAITVQSPSIIESNIFKSIKTSGKTGDYTDACIRFDQAASSGSTSKNNKCLDSDMYVASYTTGSIDNISDGNKSMSNTDTYVFAGSGGYFSNERTYTNSALTKLYISSAAGRPSMDSRDAGHQLYDATQAKVVLWNGASWVNIDGSTTVRQGSTAERPTANLYVGLIYKDTTLGKLIVWDGDSWVSLNTTTL